MHSDNFISYPDVLSDPVSLVRDHNITEKLVELGISVQSYNGDLLYEPSEVYGENGHAFTTFDPFWKRCLNMQMEAVSLIPPWKLIPAEGKVEKCSIEELGLENESEKSSNALLGRAWSPGWSNADKALIEFVEKHLLHYSKNRLKVGGDSTSLLSPYLYFGELSVRKVFQLAWPLDLESTHAIFVSIFHSHVRALLGNLKFFPWNADPDNFKIWRQ
ncbi:Rossmann-like alpha/beta/alpha sandwich fold, partial [Sesbania bispinosa]